MVIPTPLTPTPTSTEILKKEIKYLADPLTKKIINNVNNVYLYIILC